MYDKCSDCEYGDIENLRLENQELKKQLRDYKKWYQNELEENSKLSRLWCESKLGIIELETQQKEFIEYLEDYIEVLKSQQENVNGLDILEEETLFILEETLEKYKEIIGVDD